MLDRRHSYRFEVPGAQVKYELGNGESAEVPMKNITHGGVCFGIIDMVNEGTFMELEILFPGDVKITIKGNIVWSNESDAAIQFLPFGTDERYNSFQCHQLLKGILTESDQPK
jgi:hypothetical protein